MIKMMKDLHKLFNVYFLVEQLFVVGSHHDDDEDDDEEGRKEGRMNDGDFK